MNILDFEFGTDVVRTEPAKSYGETTNFFTGEKILGVRDRSYLGEKLTLVSIANGQIYLKSHDSFRNSLLGDKLISVPIDLWDEGWEKWVDPLSVNGASEPKSSIKKRYEEAVLREDYELANKLKKKLN